MRKIVYWSLFAAMLAVYGVMISWTLPQITADAGGLPFDMRPGGYTAQEARTFLSALSEQGRSLYAGPQRWLDAFYPALLAVVLIWSMRWAAMGKARFLLWVGSVLVVVGMIADYLENILVARLLNRIPADIPDSSIQWASAATVTKSGATTLAFVVLLGLLLRRAYLKFIH